MKILARLAGIKYSRKEKEGTLAVKREFHLREGAAIQFFVF
jgi:hypothetical protein